eukprot:Skav209228  [mRNA]  locus=scaffold293:121256:122537:- [translate_table: standard]
MSRGGARHFAKPDVDPGVLLRTLRDHAETIKDLGTYETISKAGAVNPKGLLYCKSLLQDIIEIAPTCQIGPQALRTSLMQLLTHNVTLNTSKFNGSTWANIKSERLTVLLAHCRKVARDKEQQRVCAGKLTAQEFQQLQLLIAEVVLKDEDEPLQKGKTLKRKVSDASLDSEGFPAMLQTPKDKNPCKKGKALKRKVSDASLDSEGFPAMLQTPKDKNPCKKGKSPRRNGNNSPSTKNSSPKKNNTRALVKREDKALNISGEGLGQATGRKALWEKGQAQKDNETKKWESLRVTNAKNPERAYITGCHQGTTQRKLIAEVPAKWTKRYKAVVAALKEAIEKKNLTKAEALLLRSQLLKKETT